jgi:hypothetical protein
MSSLTAFESCLSMPQPTGAGRPAASCAWTRTACLYGRLSVSRGPSTPPYLLLLSLPRHTSSLSSSLALSSTLRRKTLSRLMEGPSLAGLAAPSARLATCPTSANSTEPAPDPHDTTRQNTLRISFKRPNGPRGRSYAPKRKNGPVWIASRLIRRSPSPPVEPFHVHAKPPVPAVQAHQNETGHSNPIDIYRYPRLRSTTFYPSCGKITLVCN